MERGQCFPLDATEIWYSLEDAQNYAATDPTAYVGQSIKVIEDGTVKLYLISNEDGDLISASSDVELEEITSEEIAALFE